MKVQIITPENFMGDVVGDMNSRRGIIKEIDDKGEGKADQIEQAPGTI